MGKDKKQKTTNDSNLKYDTEQYFEDPILEAESNELYNSDFKFSLIVDVLENLLTPSYEYQPVEKTGYENVSNKTLFSIFNYPNFKNLPKKKILNLCSEVNKRICKTLQITPSVFVEMDSKNSLNSNFENTNKNGKGNSMVYLLTDPYTNKVYLNFKFINAFEGDSIISSIFHETFHSYQLQQLNRMNKGEVDIDIDNLIANFQTLAISSHICFNNEMKAQKESEKTKAEVKAEKKAEKERLKLEKKTTFNGITFKEIRQLKKPYRERSMEYRFNNDYYFDLCELEANLFANRMMNKLYDNQIIPMIKNTRSSIDLNTSAQFTLTFTNRNIEKEKHLLKTYLSIIKDNYKNYEKYLKGNDLEVLESFLENVTPKAIDDYYGRKSNELRSIKNLFYYEKDLLDLDEYYAKNGMKLPLNENL